MMIAVVLLSLLVIGLMAMFYQVQRAFRLGTAQADVMEGGRATMNIIVGELEQMSATGLLDTTNFLVVPSESPPRKPNESTSQVLPSGETRLNVLQDFSFVRRMNDEWVGVAYRLSNSVSGVGTLYRLVARGTNDSNPEISADMLFDLSSYVSTAVPGTNPDFRFIADGIVHLSAVAYDTNGLFFTNAAERVDFGFGFIDNELPAYVDLELALLEPSVLAKFRAREEVDVAMATDYQSATNCLVRSIGGTHVFRQRVEIHAGRNFD
jgi:hypothetical protein